MSVSKYSSSADGVSSPLKGGSGEALSILYIGSDSGTSRHRYRALRRLGCNVRVVDPMKDSAMPELEGKWAYHTGALFMEKLVRGRVLTGVPNCHFDLAFVDAGELVGPGLVKSLRDLCRRVINFNVDDPFGNRDGRKWRLYKEAVPEYDLIVVVRDCNLAEGYRAGARAVLKVFRSADEEAHKVKDLPVPIRLEKASEVAFIGTWMPERGPILSRLIDLKVPLSIFGNRWNRAPEWPLLQRHWRGPGQDNDDEYAAAVQTAKICLGLVSKENRDSSTTRSFEIPHMGVALCAERTDEHLSLYTEDVEAAFWSTPEECAEKCFGLLRDVELRNKIAQRGQARCLANGTTNQKVLAGVLSSVLSFGNPAATSPPASPTAWMEAKQQ